MKGPAMLMGFEGAFEADGGGSPSPVFASARPVLAAPRESGGTYGARQAPNWPVIALIAALHAVAITGLFLFDVVPLRHARAPMLVTLVPDQIAPPLAPPPAAAMPDHAPVDAPPPPPQMAVTIANVSAAPVLAAPPPPVAVAAPDPAPPAAVTAPPAPITPPDASAATLRNSPPEYPVESRRRHEQGTVRLRVLITVEGRVKEIGVTRSSGFDRLDKAALDAVRKWHFQPGSQAGVPVEAVGTLAIPFTLT